MRKEALAKDFRMEIRNSLNRFLSIFFIVAMGVAFFSGVRAGEPDMKYSGDEYFDERNMMDLKVMSTLGLTDDDVDALLEIEGVKEVNPGYMIDVLSTIGDSERIVHLESLPDTMNQVDVVSGRLPRNARECIVDVDAAASYGIQIGDMLTFESGNDRELKETLIVEEYEVVGTCSSPTYISFNRGSTNIGNGAVDLFTYIHSASFCEEVYSQIWITVAGAKEATAFTKEYETIVDQVKEKIEGIADVRCDARYAEIMEEANAEIAEAESELLEAKEEVEVELADAEAELRDGEAQIASGKAELKTSQKELADAKAQLEDGRFELDEGWRQYNEGMTQLKDGKAQMLAAEEEIAANEALITDGESQIKAAEEEIAANEALIADGEAQIAEAEATIETTEAMLAASEAALAEAKTWESNIASLQQTYDSGILILNDKKVELALTQQWIASGTLSEEEAAQYQAQADQLQMEITELEVELSSTKMRIDLMNDLRPTIDEVLAMEEEIVSGRAELEAGKVELERQKALLADGKAQLEAGKIEIETQKVVLADGRAQLEAGKEELAAQKQVMFDGEKTLNDSYLQLMDAEAEYQSGWEQISHGESQIASGLTAIAENEQKISDGWIELEKGRKEAEEEIADAELKIADAKEEIDSIEKPEWFVNDRNSDMDYAGYGDNAERMGAIGKVFPILFFLVAALISLTTMTRMVEEQRMQIGTLKALGYNKFSIAFKFIGYALMATLGGSIVGVLIGEKAFPWIIVSAYKILYNHIPNLVIPYHLGYAVMGTGAAVACTMLATSSACYKALAAQPASLMRPEAPKVGKKILLERIPFIWKRLNFTWKSTMRNLLRYKKRFFMTVFGIGGCMALMLVGYGLKDSIMDVPNRQFAHIHTYDLMAYVDEEISDEDKQALDQMIQKDKDIEGSMEGYMRLTEMKFEKTNKDIYLYVPSTLTNLDQFIRFNYRTSGKTWRLSEDSVIISEKVARDLGIKKGDEISLELEENHFVTVQITDICENYLGHYIYMTPQIYAQFMGNEPEYNSIYVKVKEEAKDNLEKVGGRFVQNEGVLTVSYTHTMAQDLEETISVLDSIIIVLIVSAGMLAFVVLYNLNNININERKRELATLKVLGFYDSEVAAYVFRENVVLTFVGSGLGVLLGKLLHGFVVKTVEVDQTMFGLNITMKSYLISIGFTVAFSLLVNGFMYFKLKKINMVESLKSVE